MSRLLVIGKCRHRYSNTLLLSLNNRIAIREESAAIGSLPTSGLASGALVAATFNVRESVMHAELEMSPQVFNGRKLSEVQDKVIGGYCGTSLTKCHSIPGPDYCNRYLLIWVFNDKTSVDDDYHD